MRTCFYFDMFCCCFLFNATVLNPQLCLWVQWRHVPALSVEAEDMSQLCLWKLKTCLSSVCGSWRHVPALSVEAEDMSQLCLWKLKTCPSSVCESWRHVPALSVEAEDMSQLCLWVQWRHVPALSVEAEDMSQLCLWVQWRHVPALSVEAEDRGVDFLLPVTEQPAPPGPWSPLMSKPMLAVRLAWEGLSGGGSSSSVNMNRLWHLVRSWLLSGDGRSGTCKRSQRWVGLPGAQRGERKRATHMYMYTITRVSPHVTHMFKEDTSNFNMDSHLPYWTRFTPGSCSQETLLPSDTQSFTKKIKGNRRHRLYMSITA